MRNNARTGGILTIISGAFGILLSLWMVFAALMMRIVLSAPSYSYGYSLPAGLINLMMVFYFALGLFFFLVSVLGIVGGVFALKRRYWGVALAGAIAGNITFSLCGIPALIFVTLAKPEFSARKPARRRRR
jgi:hypothetical protein